MAKQIKGARLSEGERQTRFAATRVRKAAKVDARATFKSGTGPEPRFKGDSFFYDTPEAVLPSCKGARAQVSITVELSPGVPMFRLPVDTTDREHVQQAVDLLTAK